MKSISDLLSEHSFFDGLPSETLELIAGCGWNVHFDSDALIMAENAPADIPSNNR